MSASTNQAFDALHDRYAQTNWIDKPNIFAEQVLKYLSNEGRLLDLGSGQGQDSRYFASKGYDVISLDISDKAVTEAKAKASETNVGKLEIRQSDISKKLPFEDEYFDVAYAHLSLHYFDAQTTDAILQEIRRVLKTEGIIAFLVNSTSDPEFGNGEKLENNFYFVENKNKRFFSIESAREFANKYFTEILADNKGETYKDSEKGIHNLIRYIGKK